VGETSFAEPDFAAPKRIEAVLVGAGSIGGACIYALARTPRLDGELDIVDYQTLEEKNPDRALLATLQQARAEAAKAVVGGHALDHLAGLKARPHTQTIAEFVAERPIDATLPLVLSAVDSVASRREIQDCLPLELIDAACSPDEVSISGHRTDDGPCVYCMHVGPLLQSEQIRLRLIARATGFAEKMVAGLIVTSAPLTAQHLSMIERHRGLPTGSLLDYEGETLAELWRKELLYGEARVRTSSGGEAAVAAPFVTALAGFLLAGEALKQSDAAFAPYRLGTLGALPTRYAESPWGSPFDRQLIALARWEGHECLCRSGRRLRLLRRRYGLQ
jgi:hypothetical protein